MYVDKTTITAKATNINTWYTTEYPTDEYGEQLKKTATFYDLFEALDHYENIYEKFNIEDTLVRERLFEKLSKIMECDYDDVYYQCLNCDNY